ncbi:MAG: 4-hydroxy-tetrahydrodipicolinate synthase [Balneolaceae bacterium]|nr:4-hydroxy-tetrahydrodipicolinate synthase [Balneolaceae bacterium]MBO6546669.1 4-hydroxy-tetrahydrodipicolinate synthase [Balneolaceae bacterium]MBO6649027.1 4-hydroxy-tetrahydrodipicolinate synthase [Balneolaceae bacterium]
MIKHPLWTAIVTPLKKDGGVDYNSFEFILRKQEEAGNGILVLGSTGEGLNLLDEEKREIVKFAKLLKLEVPLMAGLGGFHINGQIDFMKYCDEVGVDAFLLVNPIYAKPGKEGQLAWFSTLMKETKTPCMVYNVPSRTGIHMHPEVPATLSKTFPNYMGLKEASGSIEKLREFIKASPKSPVYCGDDNLIKEFVEEGAVGLVSVASNAWPKKTHKQLSLFLEGKPELTFKDWVACADLLFDAPSPIPVKTLMQHKGWIANDQVRLPLSANDLKPETEEALLEADKKINEWFEQETK